MRATKHFQYGLLDPQRTEKKQNYLHKKAPNKQKKNEKSFWVFILISTTSMEIILTNVLVFLKVYQTHKKKARKRILN